jgi:DNA-binding Lrp family transcriptional regulator
MAAVLHHREAGFRANAMGVWAVPAGRAEEVGPIMASFKGVSHCYLRPTYPDWPYSIFTMVHGQEAADCQRIIDAISAATGITEYALLYSTKEYKKVRLKYFTPELEEWESRARRAA